MIVDASVAFKWLVKEADSDLAIAWVASGEPLVAPLLILSETGHALSKRVRRGELAAAGADETFSRLPALITLIDDAPFMGRAFELSVALRHAFYDCVYLAAAEALGDRLLTADEVFAGKLADHPLGGLVTVLGRDA
ncbi:type II toxin-antitoxin system VapC family toxin [Sphingomonas sp.]|uniref:type II toxin-antitoxin system VapC family toxin n=1 Tax=Sphingomonas sp. TaxID=28214 RepID=UPI003341DA3F